jgi:hypothetical protein
MKTNNRKSGQTYYVAGLARYVLVQARSLNEARAKGEERLERPAHVVRLATPDEIGLHAFHDRMIRESEEKLTPFDRLSTTDTSWSDHALFRRLGLRHFSKVAGKYKVGTVNIDRHRVAIGVHCLPAMFWDFQITGPLFRGRISTGSGALVDYWWAVEALIRGTVTITCPDDIQREANSRAYSVTGNVPDDQMRFLRHLLASGMLVVEPL